MELKTYFSKAEFNTSKLGSDKLCFFVEFPNCISKITGKPFKWMPTYDQIKLIVSGLDYVERKSWNKEKNDDDEECEGK